MSTDTGDRMKIVIGYAVWASLCAVVAGVAISLIHTWFFAHEPGRVGFWRTLFEDGVRTVAIAAGQGAVALVTGSLLAHLGRALRSEEHTSELQSRLHLVCRLLLEKKKTNTADTSCAR